MPCSRLLLLVWSLLSACAPPPGGEDPGGEDPAAEAAATPDRWRASERPEIAISPIRAPASVYVHVEDRAGSAVAGATVRVGGQTAATDERGDAQLSGFQLGDALTVHISGDGYLNQVRALTLDGEGVHRVWGVLTGDADRCDADGLCAVATYDPSTASADTDDSASEPDLVAEVDGFAVGVDAEDLVDGLGRDHEGAFTVSLVGFETHGDGGDPEMPWSPGSLITHSISDPGDDDQLESLGMLNVQIRDEDGAPLFIKTGETVTVTRQIPGDDVTEDEIAAAEWWYLDEVSGRWALYEGVRSTLGGDNTLSAELSHFTTVNIDLRLTPHCANVEAKVPPNLISGASLEIVGPAFKVRRPVSSGPMLIRGLPKNATAALYLYDGLVEGPVSLDVQTYDSETETCSAEKVTLTPDADAAPGSEDSGSEDAQDPGELVVRVRAGDCPATGMFVRLWRNGSDGATREEIDTWRASDPTRWLEGLPAGTYALEAWDLGELVGSADVEIAGGGEPTLATLEVPASFADETEGGCAPLPCEGDACNACVSVTVLEGGAAPESEVRVYIGEDQVGMTSDGAVCEQVEGAADLQISISTLGAEPVLATLPRGGDCVTGGCAEVVLTLGDGETCAAGSERAEVESAWLGYEDPGFYTTDQLRPPLDVDGGTMTLRVEASGLTPSGWDVLETLGLYCVDGADPSSCTREGSLSGGLWAWIGVVQDSDGTLSEGGLHVRAYRRGKGLAIDVDEPVSAMATHARSGSPETMEVSITIRDSGYEFRLEPRLSTPEVGNGDVQVQTWGAGSDAATDPVTLLGFEDGKVILQLTEIGFQSGGVTMTLNGTIAVPLVSTASFDLDEDNAWERPLYGSFSTLLRDDAEVTSLRFGPAEAQYDLKGELLSCAPDDGAFMMVGESFPGALVPFSPILRMEDGEFVLGGDEVETEVAERAERGGDWEVWWPARYMANFDLVDVEYMLLTDRVAIGARHGISAVYLNIQPATVSHNVFGFTLTSDAITLKRTVVSGRFDVLSGMVLGRLTHPLTATVRVTDFYQAESVEEDNASTTTYDATTSFTLPTWNLQKLTWIDEHWLQDRYASHSSATGEPTASLSTIATVVGKLRQCGDDGLCSEPAYDLVELHPSVEDPACSAVQSVTPDPQTGLFLLYGIDPACSSMSEPYRLVVYRTGEPDPVTTVSFVAIAGGVLTLLGEDD